MDATKQHLIIATNKVKFQIVDYGLVLNSLLIFIKLFPIASNDDAVTIKGK